MRPTSPENGSDRRDIRTDRYRNAAPRRSQRLVSDRPAPICTVDRDGNAPQALDGVCSTEGRWEQEATTAKR